MPSTYAGYGLAAAASNTFLLGLAGNDATLLEEKLNSADQEIDEAFSTGGYGTPLPLSAIPAVTAAEIAAKARFVARLATTSKAIAAYLLSAPSEGTNKRGSAERVVKDCEDARKWLAAIAGRTLVIGVLEVTDGGVVGGSYTGMSAVGTARWDLTPELFDIHSVVTE